MAASASEQDRAAAAGARGATGAVFRGVAVALVTIFDRDSNVDSAATGKFAAELVARGMQAVLVNGTTGEAATLSASERRALVGAVRAAVPATVPVIAGSGAPSWRQAAALTEDAVAAGADAVLAWPPAGSRDLKGYFGVVAEAAAGRPVLAYHIPWVSAPGVAVAELANLPVVGVKDSSGDADRLLDELAHYKGATYVGSSALLAQAGPMGGAGAILALANAEPERCVAAFSGDAAAQRELAASHLQLKRGGVRGLKQLLATDDAVLAIARVG